LLGGPATFARDNATLNINVYNNNNNNNMTYNVFGGTLNLAQSINLTLFYF